MNAKQKLHQAQLTEWATRFAAQKASGLTVRQWCDQNHLSIHKYNYWKHQLKEEVVEQVMPDIVPLPVTAPLPTPESAVPQTVPSKSDPDNRVFRTNRAIRANYTNPNVKLCVDGVSLEFDPSISEDFLRILIRAVHYA